MHILSFVDPEAYLPTFQNRQGPGEDYDFGGMIHLLLACLNHLETHTLESELEDIRKPLSTRQVWKAMESVP